MAVSMPMIVVITLVTIGVIIILNGRQPKSVLVDEDPEEVRYDFIGTPAQRVEEIFTASESTGPTPMDEVFTASESTGPTPMDEVFTASESTGPTPMDEVFTASESTGPAPMSDDTNVSVTQLRAMLQTTTNPDGTPVTLADKVETAKQVVDAIEKIETYNTAGIVDEYATITLGDVIAKKGVAEVNLYDAIQVQSAGEELSQTDMATSAELEQRIVDIEIEALALEEIENESYRLRLAEIQRELDEIADQERIEDARIAADTEKRRITHIAALANYEFDQEKQQSVIDDMLTWVEEYKTDEARLKAEALEVQTRVNLAKLVENERLANELLKLDDMVDTTAADAERKRLKDESDIFIAGLEKEIETVNDKLTTSITERGDLLEAIEAEEGLLRDGITEAEALDTEHLNNEVERLSAIEFERLTEKERSDVLLALNKKIEDEHNVTINDLKSLTAEQVTFLETERAKLYEQISDRRIANDKILEDARDAFEKLTEDEVEATEEKLTTSKSVIGAEAAMRRGSDIQMHNASVSRYTAQRRAIVDDLDTGKISPAALATCGEKYEKLTTCHDAVMTRNTELYETAIEMLGEHYFKMTLGFNLTRNEYSELIENTDIEKVWIPFDFESLKSRKEAARVAIAAIGTDTTSIMYGEYFGFTTSGGWGTASEGLVKDDYLIDLLYNGNGIMLGVRAISADARDELSRVNEERIQAGDAPIVEIALDLAAMGYSSYEGNEDRYANGIDDVYLEISGFEKRGVLDGYADSVSGPELKEVACAIENEGMLSCLEGLNEDGTLMTEEEQADAMEKLMFWENTCNSNRNINMIEPMDCFVSWDKSGCRNPKLLGEVVPFHVAGYDYGDMTATVEHGAMFDGRCDYVTGQKRACKFGDKYSEARAKLEMAEAMLESTWDNR